MRSSRACALAAVATLLGLGAMGCGPTLPSQSQARAQKQWFNDHVPPFEGTVAPLLNPWKRGNTILLRVSQCQEMAHAAAGGKQAPPMPIRSLDKLWQAYVMDVSRLAEACSRGGLTNPAMYQPQARAAVSALTEMLQGLRDLAAEAPSLR